MSNETDKLDEAKAAIYALMEMQDEVIQLLTLVYMYQHEHTSEDNPCPDAKVEQVGKYVFREMMALSIWANVVEGRMMMHFEDGSDEPKFSMTEKGRKFVEDELPAVG